MHTEELTILLIDSAKLGRHDLILSLLETAYKENLFPVNFDEPLSWAAHNGHTEAALLFLQKGANINYQDSQGNTPLHWAAYNGHREMVKLLIRSGANERLLNKNSLTPSVFAKIPSNSNQLNCIPHLIKEMSHEIKLLKARVTELENALASRSSTKDRYLSSQRLAMTDAQVVSRVGAIKNY